MASWRARLSLREVLDISGAGTLLLGTRAGSSNEVVLTLPYLQILLFAIAAASPAPAPRLAQTRAASACVAVTRADVEQALGRAVTGGQGQAEGVESTCDFAGGDGQVTVTIERLPAKLDLPAEMRSLKEQFPEARVREATGIGTRAFFLDIEGAGTQLHVIRGDREYLLVSVLGFGDAAHVSAAAEQIARKALDRL